ncbi:9113_t:CDS:2, partial [Paraglomus brasilianum]
VFVLKSYFESASERDVVPSLSEFVQLNTDFVSKPTPRSNHPLALESAWTKRFESTAKLLNSRLHIPKGCAYPKVVHHLALVVLSEPQLGLALVVLSEPQLGHALTAVVRYLLHTPVAHPSSPTLRVVFSSSPNLANSGVIKDKPTGLVSLKEGIW